MTTFCIAFYESYLSAPNQNAAMIQLCIYTQRALRRVDKMGDTEIRVQNPEPMLNDDTDSLLKEDSETSIPLDILDLEVK
jgi:hypothetical protein